MGMVSGVIEVVDESGSQKPSEIFLNGDNNSLVPSGASGCGAGASCGCGCGRR